MSDKQDELIEKELRRGLSLALNKLGSATGITVDSDKILETQLKRKPGKITLDFDCAGYTSNFKMPADWEQSHTAHTNRTGLIVSYLGDMSEVLIKEMQQIKAGTFRAIESDEREEAVGGILHSHQLQATTVEDMENGINAVLKKLGVAETELVAIPGRSPRA